MAAAENPLPNVLPQTHCEDARGLVLQHAANELIFGVVGHVGSGTSEIAEALRDILSDATLAGGAFQVQILKARDVIRDWAKQNGEALPDETARRLGGTITFQNLGDKMRAQPTSSGEPDYPAVARGLVLRVRESRAKGLGQAVNGTDPVMPDGTRRAYVLDSLRHPAEIHLLRHVYQEAFVLIGVVCEEKQRLTRLTKKYRDAGEEDARAFMKRDAEAAEKHGQHVADTFHLSDFFVDNTTDRLLENKAPNPHWDTNEKLARLMKILTHSEIVRPAMAEVAMHHAYGAMMQSACLSRQVGAALVDANGNVVATGTNEVPKAGGGVYGESFVVGESDDRCGLRTPEGRRYCSNTREQNRIIEELVAEIPELAVLNTEQKRDLMGRLRRTRIGSLLEFSRAVHAEMDALLSAARQGISPIGTRLFVTTFPCHYCARHLVTDRAVNLKTFLKADDRVDKVARFVSQHFRENVEPLGYKAFLVGVDREACALYKNALDKYLPAEYSAVVYTSAHNDSQLLAEFKLNEDEEKRIRRAFIKRDTQPKILIVTEKLLTGFDAPILYCMYLDKPMRDHTLLQAIARVNRPYEDEDGVKKPAGYVLDFVGIFEKLERALAFDSDIVGSAIQNIDVLKHQFATLMDEQAPPYLALCSGPVDDKTLEKAIEVFEGKQRREAFYKLFKELEMLYEIISPDVFLRPHIENYGKLSLLYQIVTNAFSKKVALIKDLMRKTEDLVKRTATGTGFESAMKVVRIDENTVEALKTEKGGEPPKVINLGKSLLTAISEEANNQPYLIPIGERTEAILEGYDDRQITTQSALQQLAKLMEEYLQAKRERDRTGFDINTFTLFWVLKQSGAREADQVAPKVDAAFRKYPNYRDNVAEERQLKAEVYKLVLPAVGKEGMVAVVKRLLELQRS